MDRHDISPNQLHKSAGIHLTTAWRLYREPDYIPRPDTMDKLAKAYGWKPGKYLDVV